MYPSTSEIIMALDDQIEEWFLTLPKFKNRMELIKWTLISNRYYNGEMDDES